MDWIKSPFEVPMPTQRDVSPVEPLGALGNTRVDTASRIQEFEETGPVLKDGPKAASTEVKAMAARTETNWREGGILTTLIQCMGWL